MATAIEIINTIRDNQTATYMARVPEATRENLSQVGDAILKTAENTNAFVNALIDKVAFSNVVSKLFNNPLSLLKKSGVPYGKNIEEIFVNPSMDAGYGTDGNLLLKTTKPDGKTAYYGLNRQSCYPVTVQQETLKQAFKSEQSFMSFYNGIVASLFSGDNIDEFMLIKGLLGKTIDDGAMLVVDTDLETSVKDLCKSISNISKSFAFPSTSFCGYNLVNKLDDESTEKPCITFCPPEKQCLIVRADVQTEIDYEVLATMFHMEVTKLEAMTILVDDIPSETHDVYAVLCDRDAIDVRDSVFEMRSQENGATLSHNFWLHHWQYLFVSMFANCVAFGKAKTGE